MPWQIIPVEYSRASISCDWLGCTNRISLSAIPADYDAENTRHQLDWANERIRDLENNIRSHKRVCPMF